MATSVTQENIFAGSDVTQGQQILYTTIVLSGNYGTASSHGDVLNLSQLKSLLSSKVPIHADIDEQPAVGTAPSGYSFVFQPGTTLANCGLSVMNGAATEYSQGSAYSAPLLAAVIKMRIWLPRI